MIKQFVLGYVVHSGGVLMLERTVPGHPQFGYWNGVGGKVEQGETWTQAMQRELLEETGLTGNCKYRGSVHFSNGHLVHMFRITEPRNQTRRYCSEGTLHLIHVSDVLEVPLYSGQEVWLPMILGDGEAFAVSAEWDETCNKLVSYEVLE